MILSEYDEFCDATALNTGAAGTYNVGDIIDTNNDGINLADDLWLVIRVATTATSGGSATGQFRLVSDATTSISTTTATVHVTSAAFAVAAMTAGVTLLAVKLPKDTYERYLGIQQITGTAAFTAGAIDAFLTNDIDAWKAFPDGVN